MILRINVLCNPAQGQLHRRATHPGPLCPSQKVPVLSFMLLSWNSSYLLNKGPPFHFALGPANDVPDVDNDQLKVRLPFSLVLLSPEALSWWQQPLSAHRCGVDCFGGQETIESYQAPCAVFAHSTQQTAAVEGEGLKALLFSLLPASDFQRECIYKYAFTERRKKSFSFLHTNLHKTTLYSGLFPLGSWMIKSRVSLLPFEVLLP